MYYYHTYYKWSHNYRYPNSLQNPGKFYYQKATLNFHIEKTDNFSDIAIAVVLVDEMSGLTNIKYHILISALETRRNWSIFMR